MKFILFISIHWCHYFT